MFLEVFGLCPAVKVRFWVRSSGSVLLKKDVLKNFAKFTGKQPCQGPFFNKVDGLRSTILLNKRL